MIEVETPLFASLPEPALERIRRAVDTRTFRPGDVMLAEGETRGELFVLLSGEAVVTGRDWHGEPIVLARLGAGECFGEMSMLSGEPPSATVEAATDAVAWALPHAAFVAIADEHPELARNLSALLSERLRASNERQLRAQRGQLAVLVALEDAPWAALLAYHIARSVAKHTRQAVTLLDPSGRAGDALRSVTAVVSLDEALQAVRPAPNGTDAASPGGLLQVIAEEVPSERQLVGSLDRLCEQMRFVLTLVPRQSSTIATIVGRAGSVLALARSSHAGAAADLASLSLAKDAKTGIVLLGEHERAPTVGDVRRAQSYIGARWPVRGIIPGGDRGLEREPVRGSTAGDAIDRVARGIAGLTVGLALGGGGAKGYAHIGAVRVLQQAGVPFDCVTGCSIGAPLAAGVAAGWSLEMIRNTLESVSQKAVRPNIPLVSLLTSRSIRRELQTITQNARFDELPTPCGIVAVDIETGEEVLLRSGLVWPAMAASMAYPGIYEPVRLGGHLLVDGGVLNPVPVSAAVTLGADVVISSNLSGTVEERIARPPAGARQRRRYIIENIARSLEIMQSKIVSESCTRADVSIRPVFDPMPGLLEFKRGLELELAGQEAAERELPNIRALLPWLA